MSTWAQVCAGVIIVCVAVTLVQAGLLVASGMKLRQVAKVWWDAVFFWKMPP